MYVILLDHLKAIGPFETIADAKRYREASDERARLRIIALVRPGWRFKPQTRALANEYDTREEQRDHVAPLDRLIDEYK